MGGSKKPTAANKSAGGSKDAGKKGKKDKGTESSQKKAEIIVKVDGAQALRIVKGTKVITVQELARQLGVKISAANSFLKDAVSQGSVSVIGGHSGHYLYQDSAVVATAVAKAEAAAPTPGAAGSADTAAAATDAAAKPSTESAAPAADPAASTQTAAPSAEPATENVGHSQDPKAGLS